MGSPQPPRVEQFNDKRRATINVTQILSCSPYLCHCRNGKGLFSPRHSNELSNQKTQRNSKGISRTWRNLGCRRATALVQTTHQYKAGYVSRGKEPGSSPPKDLYLTSPSCPLTGVVTWLELVEAWELHAAQNLSSSSVQN